MTQIFQDDPRAARMLLLEATSIDVELTDRLMSVYDTARGGGGRLLRERRAPRLPAARPRHRGDVTRASSA